MRLERDGDGALTAEEHARVAKSDAEKARIAALAETLVKGWSFLEREERLFDPFGRYSSVRGENVRSI